MKNTKGITLIVLVITIIVLLILAGISIATLTGQNGILSRANDAKKDTQIAEVKERSKTDILGVQSENNGNISKKQFIEILNKYFKDVPSEKNLPEDLSTLILETTDKYGKHEIRISDIYNGKFSDNAVSIPTGLEVGSTVTYTPRGTYIWKAEYCSSTKTISTDDIKLDSGLDNYKINSWKVLDIDNETEKITLIASTPTTGTVYLGEAQGYNNGVTLLNEACSNLYGDINKGITARSINIEDIEGKMTDEALAEAHSYQNAAKYGEQVSNAYTSSNYYPSIYAKEVLSVINGNKNNSGLAISEQTGLIKSTAENATSGYLKATSSIQPYQTYWYRSNQDMQTSFKNASNGVNYYNLLMPNGNSAMYWVASRCIYTYSDNCSFLIRYVCSDYVGAHGMFNSVNNIDSSSYSLFPVVSLNYSLIEGNATDGFFVK